MGKLFRGAGMVLDRGLRGKEGELNVVESFYYEELLRFCLRDVQRQNQREKGVKKEVGLPPFRQPPFLDDVEDCLWD